MSENKKGKFQVLTPLEHLLARPGMYIGSINLEDYDQVVPTQNGPVHLNTKMAPGLLKIIDEALANASDASLNDPNKAVLIDINDEGLVPISDFIFEDNFKRNIRLNRGSIFHTPSIQIFWRQIDHHKVSPVMVLKTRLNDNLIISNSNLVLEINQVRSGNYDLNDAINHFDTLIDNKTFFYDLNVVGINLIRPFLENSTTNHYNIFDINEGDMQKFYNSNNGILYLLYESTDKKFAYAIHDDYILDTYGIRDWVDLSLIAGRRRDSVVTFKETLEIILFFSIIV